MSAAYDRVRQALEDTPLAGDLDRLNAELHLTPDAAEWIIAVLSLIGTAALSQDLRAVERALGRLPDTLEASMRASGAEIVRGLGEEIAASTTVAIKNDTLTLLQRVADTMESAVDGFVGEARVATTAATQSVGAEIAATSSAMSQASLSLAQAAGKVGGWTPARIASIALGTIIAAALFAAGNALHAADVVLGCPARVEHATRALHQSPHDANVMRNSICGG